MVFHPKKAAQFFMVNHPHFRPKGIGTRRCRLGRLVYQEILQLWDIIGIQHGYMGHGQYLVYRCFFCSKSSIISYNNQL